MATWHGQPGAAISFYDRSLAQTPNVALLGAFLATCWSSRGKRGRQLHAAGLRGVQPCASVDASAPRQWMDTAVCQVVADRVFAACRKATNGRDDHLCGCGVRSCGRTVCFHDCTSGNLADGVLRCLGAWNHWVLIFRNDVAFGFLVGFSMSFKVEFREFSNVCFIVPVSRGERSSSGLACATVRQWYAV